jgi:hypothetical protein
MVPNRRASSTATDWPTWRIPRPNRRTDSGCSFGDELCRRLTREALERHELIDGDRVEIGDVVNQSRVEQLAHPFITETADVHRAA